MCYIFYTFVNYNKNMDILKKIDCLREEKGWSIYKLAEEANISQSTLSNMFIRKTLPSISTLELICKAFNLTLSKFFADEEEISNIETKEMISNFNKLNDKNKQAVSKLIKDLI